MSDIFISYASDDRPRAAAIAKALESEGWSVWWDRNIPAGARFSDIIQEELARARCVVVLWSAASIKKDWVIDEASEGRDRKVLVPVLAEPVRPPLGFRQIQAADLSSWQGDSSDAGFLTLRHHIASMLGAPALPATIELSHHDRAPAFWFRRRRLLGGVALAALAALGVWYFRRLSPHSVSLEPTEVVRTGDTNGRVATEPTAAAPAKTAGASTHAGDVRTNAKDGLEYVWIVPGEFWMGATPSDKDAPPSEKPRHLVRITKGFSIGRTLVTVAAYKRFDETRPDGTMPGAPVFNRNWRKTDHPIGLLTWDEAEAYCEWAGGRLPTEAEWEYAARGRRDGLKYPWGNEISPRQANYAHTDNTWRGTSPVRTYPPNAFGLYDMAGNLWQWVGDWYDRDYYSSGAPDKPAVDPHGPDHSTGYRVKRGGSFASEADHLRTSQRWSDEPVVRNDTGFRCALSAL
jgi:formylglycine-generating enzyme required for sulfatase activity